MNTQIRKHSKKRDAILDAIRSTCEHPSAEWVYNNLKHDYPDLSLGTVYRNIALFKKSGDIVCVGCVDGQDRFDATTLPHPHFICQACNRVIDLDLAFSANDHYPDVEKIIDGVVTGENLIFYGLCNKCAPTADPDNI